MSENMKKIYQAYADSIAPAPDMQERLKRQLYAEMQGERPRKRNYGRGQFSRWLVVACMLFLVSGGCLIYAVMGTSGHAVAWLKISSSVIKPLCACSKV